MNASMQEKDDELCEIFAQLKERDVVVYHVADYFYSPLGLPAYYAVTDEEKAVSEECAAKADALKAKGTPGVSERPKPNYDDTGMTREQSEANAWRNYAIETGAVSAIGYDMAVEKLIACLEECADFYEKAVSIV